MPPQPSLRLGHLEICLREILSIKPRSPEPSRCCQIYAAEYRYPACSGSQIYLTASFVKPDVGQARPCQDPGSFVPAVEPMDLISNDTRQTGKLLEAMTRTKTRDLGNSLPASLPRVSPRASLFDPKVGATRLQRLTRPPSRSVHVRVCMCLCVSSRVLEDCSPQITHPTQPVLDPSMRHQTMPMSTPRCIFLAA